MQLLVGQLEESQVQLLVGQPEESQAQLLVGQLEESQVQLLVGQPEESQAQLLVGQLEEQPVGVTEGSRDPSTCRALLLVRYDRVRLNGISPHSGAPNLHKSTHLDCRPGPMDVVHALRILPWLDQRIEQMSVPPLGWPPRQQHAEHHPRRHLTTVNYW